jgi:5-methylcytosine-specific restriction endonuclease McrA
VEIERQSFIVCVSPEQLRKEKEKAREMRRTQWWMRQVAKGLCYYCHKKVPPAELTMDHIVALARGGKSSRGNIVPACRECNSRKKYLLPIEWDEYVKRTFETEGKS